MATHQRDAWSKAGALIYAGLSIPLGRTRPATSSTGVNRDSRGSTQVMPNPSGSARVDSNLSYGVDANHGRGAGRRAPRRLTLSQPVSEMSAIVKAKPAERSV
nr:hypothetical protein [Burkholderia cenocepacia]